MGNLLKFKHVLFLFAQPWNLYVIICAFWCRHKRRSWQILHRKEISWILWRLFSCSLMLCELCGEASINRPKVIPKLFIRWSRESHICCPTEQIQSCEGMEKCGLSTKTPDKMFALNTKLYHMQFLHVAEIQSLGCPMVAENTCGWWQKKNLLMKGFQQGWDVLSSLFKHEIAVFFCLLGAEKWAE